MCDRRVEEAAGAVPARGFVRVRPDHEQVGEHQRDRTRSPWHDPPVAGQSPLRPEAEHEPGERRTRSRAAPRATATSRPRGTRDCARARRPVGLGGARAGTARVTATPNHPTDVSTWAISTTRRDRRPRWSRGSGAPRRRSGGGASGEQERAQWWSSCAHRPPDRHRRRRPGVGFRPTAAAVPSRSAPTVGERPGRRCAHRGDGEHRGPRADLLGQRVRHPEGAVVHRARGSPRSPAPRAWPTGAGRRTRRRRAPRPRADGSW